MEIINDPTQDEIKAFLGEYGMKMFEIVSYFLEKKHEIINENHLVMGDCIGKTVTEMIEFIREEIEHYGVERLCLSEDILLKSGEYYKFGVFEFPLGEITETGEIVQSDLWAKFDFDVDKNEIKLTGFDVP